MTKALSLTTVVPKNNSLAFWLSCGAGTGLIPGAPGTYGSALAVAIAALTWSLAPSRALLLSMAALLLIAGIWSSTKICRQSGCKDPASIVIDEIAAQLLALSVFPLSWKTMLAGFVLFRFFDIVKPPPARQAERLPDGWGVMLDDTIAALYTLLVLGVAARLTLL